MCRIVILRSIYASDEISLRPEIYGQSEEQFKMINYIWERDPLLMLSVFRKSPLDIYLDKDDQITRSIDTEIMLMQRCIKIFHEQYTDILRSRKFKLRSEQYIDRIDKLTDLKPETISFMARNPQYLVEVKKKRGIKYQDKVYLPEKTLVSRNVLNYDIYENRYIVSFLKMLTKECVDLKRKVVQLQSIGNLHFYYIEALKSRKSDFAYLASQCEMQLVQIEGAERSLRMLFGMYKKAFGMEQVKDISADYVKKKPRVSAIFRQIREYNRILKGALLPWFEYNMIPKPEDIKDTADIYKLAVSNPSTTYELYILTKWKEYFEEKDYKCDISKAQYAGISEKTSRYSDYTYQFVYYKDDEDKDEREEYTIFYSPSVYMFKEKNGILEPSHVEHVDKHLFRNTLNSNVNYEEGESNSAKGAHYEPDYILKYQRGHYDKEKGFSDGVVRYMMADAKHKDYEEVIKKDVSQLMYKYLECISVRDEGNDDELKGIDRRISGLCAIYNNYPNNTSVLPPKSLEEYREDKHLSNEELQFTVMLRMKIDYDSNFEDDFADLLGRVKGYKSIEKRIQAALTLIRDNLGKMTEEDKALLSEIADSLKESTVDDV